MLFTSKGGLRGGVDGATVTLRQAAKLQTTIKTRQRTAGPNRSIKGRFGGSGATQG